jgi:hypothetical protein
MGDGAGKGVMKCDMFTENDKDRIGGIGPRTTQYCACNDIIEV